MFIIVAADDNKRVRASCEKSKGDRNFLPFSPLPWASSFRSLNHPLTACSRPNNFFQKKIARCCETGPCHLLSKTKVIMERKDIKELADASCGLSTISWIILPESSIYSYYQFSPKKPHFPHLLPKSRINTGVPGWGFWWGMGEGCEAFSAF